MTVSIPTENLKLTKVKEVCEFCARRRRAFVGCALVRVCGVAGCVRGGGLGRGTEDVGGVCCGGVRGQGRRRSRRRGSEHLSPFFVMATGLIGLGGDGFPRLRGADLGCGRGCSSTVFAAAPAVTRSRSEGAGGLETWPGRRAERRILAWKPARRGPRDVAGGEQETLPAGSWMGRESAAGTVRNGAGDDDKK